MTVSHSFSVYYTDSDSVQKMCNKDHVPSMVIQGEALRKGEKVTLFSIPNRQGVHVIFTYSIKWVKSESSWASRFDHYSNSEFAKETRKIHWYSIINSLLVVLFLTVSLL